MTYVTAQVLRKVFSEGKFRFLKFYCKFTRRIIR